MLAIVALVAEAATGRIVEQRGTLSPDALHSPSSTIKPFVLEVALAEGKAQPVKCSGKLAIDGRGFNCAHPRITTPMDGAAAIAYSCNEYFVEVALRIQPGRMAAHLRTRGFTVEEPRTEAQRRMMALGEWGVTISPRGLAAAYARLAREGNATVLNGLEGAVEFGTAQLAAAPPLKVAGKTGTSTHAWFAGWAPSRAPERVVVVFADQGRGGATAAPEAGKIFAAMRPRDAVTVKLFQSKKTVAMALEDYVDGVLGGEATGLSAQAMKAIAVAARTYAVANRGRHKAEGFDFCESTHCQDLRLGGRSARTRLAVDATAGELLWYGGSPAQTFYHKHCGGTTEAAGEMWSAIRAPYLRQLEDSACVSMGRGTWRAELEARELVVVRRSPSGRVVQIRADGRTMGYEDFQRATGNVVLSPLFRITPAAGRYLIEGHGAGHGVGLCQVGSEVRAKWGHDYRRILDFYYPGTKVGRTATGIAWRSYHAPKIDVEATQTPPLDVLERTLREAESRLGHRLRRPARVRIYPTVASFRDDTGEPGWVAASTVGGVVSIQPLRSGMDTVLLHEFLHLVIQDRARVPVPRWFEEGLALYLANPSAPATSAVLVEAHVARAPSEFDMRQSYDASRSRVRRMADRHGRAVLVSWLDTGVPAH